ncbi:MAG: hypothetical protein ACK5WZ_09320 [Pseudobdellovibrionaceae bacterium]
MYNNLTKTVLKSKVLNLSLCLKTTLGILSLSLMASCAGEVSSSGKNASASKQPNRTPAPACVPLADRPCPPAPSADGSQPIVTTEGTVTELTESSLGFFEANESSLPEAVRNAKTSVVKLIIPKDQIKTNKEINNLLTEVQADQDISNDDLIAKIKEEISRVQEQKKKDRLQGFLVQVEQCKRQNQNACKIMSEIEIQSGFLIGNKKNIVTTLDVIADYLKAKHELNTPAKIQALTVVEITGMLTQAELPIAVINSEGQIISGAEVKISPADEAKNGTPSISTATKIEKKLKSLAHFKAADNTIILRTATDIEGDPIKNTETSLQLRNSDEIFVLGFPHESKNRERNNANGKDLYVTKGKQVLVQSAKTALALSIQIEQSEETKLIGLSNDSNLGLKGAVIVNKDGELLGLSGYSKAESESNTATSKTDRATLGIKKSSAGF